MKNTIIAAYLLATAILFTGCVTPPPVEKPPTSRIFSLPKDKVWPQLVAQIAPLYPIKVIEKESGLLTTDFVNMPVGYNNAGQTQWIYSPEGFLTTWAGLRMSLTAMAVETEPGKTQVTITPHFEAFENNVSKAWQVCESNGSLENDILNKVAGTLISVPVH